MGNGTSLKPDQTSMETFQIDLNGVLLQCKEFISSMEHQTAVALRGLDDYKNGIGILKGCFHETMVDLVTIVDQLEKKQDTVTDQIKGLQHANLGLKNIIEPLQNGIYPISFNFPSKDTLNEKDTKIAELNKELAFMKSKVQALEKDASDKVQLQRRNDLLTAHTGELQKQIESIKNHHEKEKNKALQENERIKQSSRAEVVGLKEQMNTIMRQNNILRQENASYARKMEEFKRELELKRNVHVQLFSPRKGDLTDAVLREMTAMLQTQMQLENKQLITHICESYAAVNPDKPVLILCINASRLGSDVESALQGLKLNKNQGLIILHHKDTHALPNQPSERMLTSSSSEYKKLGGIFDMAFLSGKGMYPCDMNNKGVTELVNFIKTMSTQE